MANSDIGSAAVAGAVAGSQRRERKTSRRKAAAISSKPVVRIDSLDQNFDHEYPDATQVKKKVSFCPLLTFYGIGKRKLLTYLLESVN